MVDPERRLGVRPRQTNRPAHAADDRHARPVAPGVLLIGVEELARVALNSIGDGVGCTDLDGNITFLNDVAENLTGWRREEARGRPMSEVIRIVDATTRLPIPDLTNRVLRSGRIVHLPADSLLLSRDGRESSVEDSTAPLRDAEGVVSGAVIVFRDVSASRAMSAQTLYAAQHDYLTGLPNWLLFDDRLGRAIRTARRTNAGFAVLFLDLDDFKRVNDNLGHEAGDRLLQLVAIRLGECVREVDTVSRQGGDEFIVLLSEPADGVDPATVATRVLATIAGIGEVNGHRLHVTASVGIARYPEHGGDAQTLVRNADKAMYAAKEAGRSRCLVFDALVPDGRNARRRAPRARTRPVTPIRSKA